MPSISASSLPTMPVERGIRRILMATLLLGISGVTTDLLLLDHVETPTQWIPLCLLGVTALALAAHAVVRRAATVRILQALLLLFLACGALGGYFHFAGNAEFQFEMDPDIGRGDLIWNALRAKAPPALAPLAFVQLGLVGLAWSYRHPLLRGAKPAT